MLSDVTAFAKYAKYKPELQRRETWDEIVERNLQMHLDRFPVAMHDDIARAYELVQQRKVLPSMRSMQFAGKPMLLNNSRGYNCAFVPVDSIEVFAEVMFLLLGGTGVGYSVQKQHIACLPSISVPTERQKFVIGDHIEGWADAVKALVRSYLDPNKVSKPIFDYSDIRAKGMRLITSGGKAPGPEPLRICLDKIEAIFSTIPHGGRLTALQVHDIICIIADAVLAGGIRRAALICLFSADDLEMAGCKSGKWWNDNLHRARANNSAVLDRRTTSHDNFLALWDILKNSGSGEPGFYWTNDTEWGTNPCVEIGLRPNQFCNLTTMNASLIGNQADFVECAKAASLIGTLQASFTDFHYLRRKWQATTEMDALLGVSITGIADRRFLGLDFTNAAQAVLAENERIAKMIGVNLAARTTCVKPEGTSSNILGTASGIHAFHNDYYVRRIRVNKKEAILGYLRDVCPELVEEIDTNDPNSSVVMFPVKAPDGAITRHESTLAFLERVHKVSNEWVKPGHRSGVNGHNVSATISVRDDEWDGVEEWLWNNRDTYNGLSILPYFGGNYQQTPFTDSTEAEYNELMKYVANIDLRNVIEEDDTTTQKDNLACAGGVCEI